jgi:hypothetical protein
LDDNIVLWHLTHRRQQSVRGEYSKIHHLEGYNVHLTCSDRWIYSTGVGKPITLKKNLFYHKSCMYRLGREPGYYSRKPKT